MIDNTILISLNVFIEMGIVCDTRTEILKVWGNKKS